MAKQDEISSTEKLLELIRNNKRTQEIESAEPSTIASNEAEFSGAKKGFKRTVTRGKAASVGVDIGYDDLKLVKIHKISNQKHELLDYIRVPFEPDIHPGHPDFYKYLKSLDI